MLNFNPDQTLKLLQRRSKVSSLDQRPQHPVTITGPDGESLTVESLGSSKVDPRSGSSLPAQIQPPPLFNPNRLDQFGIGDLQLRRNQRSIERHIDDLYYIPKLVPGTSILEGTTATPVLSTPRAAVLSFPKDGTTSAAHWTLIRPTEWIDGKLRVKFWYSSPVGSVNNFRAFVQASTISLGEVATAGVLALSVNLDIPGPAVANTVMETTAVFSTGSINQTDGMVTFRVGRVAGNAADTNANALHVYAVIAEFVLAKKEQQ